MLCLFVSHEARIGVADVVCLVYAVHVHSEPVVTPLGCGELDLHGGVDGDVGDGEDGEQDDGDRHWLALDGLGSLAEGEGDGVDDEQEDCPQGATKAKGGSAERASEHGGDIPV